MPSTNNNSRRANRPSTPPNPPPSSVYSPSQQSIPVSMLSAAPGAGPSEPRPRNPPSTHSRPSSSAFFHGAAVPPAPSAAGNPFAQFQRPSAAHNNNNNNQHPGPTMGGYDGAFDDVPYPAGNAPKHYSTSAPAGGFAGGLLGLFGKGKGKDKDRSHKRPNNTSSASKSKATGSGKGSSKRSKSMKNHALKVDTSSLSSSAKMGIWLMGSSPKKLEKAALAQQERRRREREEKRMRQREERGGRGVGGGDGGAGYGEGYEWEEYADDGEGGEVEEW